MDKLKFKKMIGEAKKDIKFYNLYQLVEDFEYGIYKLSIINDNGTIIYTLTDNEFKMVSNALNTEYFINMSTDHIEQMIDSTIFYATWED